MECSMPDLEQVRRFLRAACDHQIALDHLEPTYVQAGARGPARVLYEVPGSEDGILRVAARRVTRDRGPEIEAALNARSSAARRRDGFARAAFYAPDLDLLFQIFPSDERLPSLPIAVDGCAMRSVLHQLLDNADDAVPLSVRAHVIRYKPERKCLLRYDMTWSSGSSGARPTVVWARLARRAKFERAADNLRRIHRAAHGIGFDVPEPFGVNADFGMEFFGPVAGRPLFGLTLSDVFPMLCRSTGRALRRFHMLPVVVDERFDVEEQLERLAENAAEFVWMLPDDTPRIAGLERELSLRLRAAGCSTLRLIHRDFHGDNVLVDRDRLALVDFEDCAMGDPADDVGSNWAQLTWHAYRAGSSNEIPSAGRRAFLEGYLGAADVSAAGHLPTYAALHCFLYAHQCLRHPRDPRRFEDARFMLATCADVLEHGLR